MENISFVIPIQNGALDIASFQKWVKTITSTSFLRRGRGNAYEILLISTVKNFQTVQEIIKHFPNVPIHCIIENKNLTVTALCERGYALAKYKTIVKIDPNNPLSKDVLTFLCEKIEKDTDIIIAFQNIRLDQKKKNNTQDLFEDVSDSFLIELQQYPQSATLLFAKYSWEMLRFTPSTEQTFAVEFLLQAKDAGLQVKKFDVSQDIPINHVPLVQHVKNLLRAYLLVLFVKTKKIHPHSIPPTTDASMVNAGFRHKKQTFVTHTTLNHTESAIESFMSKQILFIGLVVECFIVALILYPLFMLKMFVGVISVMYFADILFTFFLVIKTLRSTEEITCTKQELDSLDDALLPVYSILCPLYKESHVFPHFIDGINKLEYPKEKLDVLLLLEEDDYESIQAFAKMHLPFFVRTVVVPHSLPKTKPKACNFGLSQAKGEYIVIFDAEDTPDPLQLKKAFIAFRKLPRNVGCLQAKLHYYNPTQNLLTRFFTAEYALWFDVTLIGLQSLHTIIPLGGTSNHFRTKDLTRMNAWDPFNVTEDADLGMRLFKQGFQTAVFDSITYEEANSQIGNWIRQRSRWIKGYMQTYLVHTREIIPFIKQKGMHAGIFHLIIGGKIAFIFINPILWIITLSYFLLFSIFGSAIQALYPPVILYIAISSLIFGNYLYLFCYILGCVKNEQWGLIKYVYIIPFYWLLMSVAGCVAFYQLLFKPHYWEKTTHGLHLKKEKETKKRAGGFFIPSVAAYD